MRQAIWDSAGDLVSRSGPVAIRRWSICQDPEMQQRWLGRQVTQVSDRDPETTVVSKSWTRRVMLGDPEKRTWGLTGRLDDLYRNSKVSTEIDRRTKDLSTGGGCGKVRLTFWEEDRGPLDRRPV